MHPNQLNEIWQVDVGGGQIYEASFEVVTQWIAEGTVLPQDMVRRGNLRWIEAQKVPSLAPFFNAGASVNSTSSAPAGTPAAPPAFTPLNPYQQTVVSEPAAAAPAAAPPPPPAFAPPVSPFANVAPEPARPFGQVPPAPAADPAFPDNCGIHHDVEAKFVCDTCGSGFCPACPKSYGGNVKICPFCGAMCRPIAELRVKSEAAQTFDRDLSQGFGFEDFLTALQYPLRFKQSYFFAGLLYMFVSVGQGAAGAGSFMLAAGALICMMMANAIAFGITSNVIEDFAQGKVGGNFMPTYDDFSLWDSIVHPFLLSLGAYFVSFGLVIVVVIGTVVWGANQLAGSLPSQPELDQTKILTDPNSPFKNNPDIARQKELFGDGGMPDEKKLNAAPSANRADDEEERFRKLNDFINNQRKRQLESGIGKAPETAAAERQKMIQSFAKAALPIVLLLVVGLIWGVLYFPVACCVAGYTRSFIATVNPLVGLETVKILGKDYVKLLGLSFLMTVGWVLVSAVIASVLSPFNLPTFGNPLANAVGSWVVLYLWIAFSVLLGLVLYKNSDRLKLYRG